MPKVRIAFLTLTLVVAASAIGFDEGEYRVTARISSALVQCEQFPSRADRERCLAWTITTGEDL